MTADWLDGGIGQALTANEAVVERWLADEPGSWGYLSAHAVLACRARLGRRLTDAERRAVWSALWTRLQRLEGERP